MKKAQKIYTIQIIIGIAAFILFSTVTKKMFYNDEDIKSYLSLNDGVKEMAGSTEDLLDTLIVKNDVTFDPTSGALLKKVFSNLKPTDKEKFLFVGSSQLRVVQGEDITNSYQSLVNKKFETAENGAFQTYNLSLGGMSIPEKLIVSKKASEVLKPENILISVTPWDCSSDKVRKGVTEIENMSFTLQKDTTNTDVDQNLVFPLNVNKKISNTLEHKVDQNLTIYAKRTGMQQWLKDEVTDLLGSTNDSLDVADNVSLNHLPSYWLTFNQELDSKIAWDSTTSQSGNYSLKIVNSKSSQAKWQGDLITLKTPTKTLEFEGYSKADAVSSGTRLYAIDHQITFTDNTTLWFFNGLRFKKGTHDWEKVNTKVTFPKEVLSVKPHLLFYGGTGTVWFDDIKVFPYINDVKQANIVPNTGAEEILRERQNVSYTYGKAEWNRIKENMFSVVDYLKTSTAKNKYLLLTPFWHTDEKSAYPQKEQYQVLVNEVKAYSLKNNVTCIDASYILNKDNFGVYTNGSVKDRIDVLHFDAQAHEILAKFISKNLN